jgi:hypothetical protein
MPITHLHIGTAKRYEEYASSEASSPTLRVYLTLTSQLPRQILNSPITSFIIPYHKKKTPTLERKYGCKMYLKQRT